jgi:hypothetical protein
MTPLKGLRVRTLAEGLVERENGRDNGAARMMGNVVRGDSDAESRRRRPRKRSAPLMAFKKGCTGWHCLIDTTLQVMTGKKFEVFQDQATVDGSRLSSSVFGRRAPVQVHPAFAQHSPSMTTSSQARITETQAT